MPDRSYRLSDLTFHGPYARPDIVTGRVVWAWLAVHPWGSESWPSVMRAGWTLPTEPDIVVASPPRRWRRKSTSKWKWDRGSWVWSEYVYTGEWPEGRHPNDPLHPHNAPFRDALCYDSELAREATDRFTSWLTQRKNLV